VLAHVTAVLHHLTRDQSHGYTPRECGTKSPERLTTDTLIRLAWQVLLDLPQLECSLTSRQFYITLDVIKNVLLAAPPKSDLDDHSDITPQYVGRRRRRMMMMMMMIS
jgi:hypothetical protein